MISLGSAHPIELATRLRTVDMKRERILRPENECNKARSSLLSYSKMDSAFLSRGGCRWVVAEHRRGSPSNF